jgi:phage gpG-like protein
MENNNAYKFDLKVKNYKQGKPGLMRTISVLAVEHFRLNFKREGFMDASLRPWKARRVEFPGKRRSILTGVAGGALRDSLKESSTDKQAKVTTTKAYAKIHNEGGEITVTPQMRKFFWARYYEATKRRQEEEAAIWRGMALKKGNVIKIDQRQFMGHSKSLNDKIDRAVKHFMSKL